MSADKYEVTSADGSTRFIVSRARNLSSREVVKFRIVPGFLVSDYFVQTFMAIEGGLNLYGGVPSWSISADTVTEIQRWLRDNEPLHLACFDCGEAFDMIGFAMEHESHCTDPHYSIKTESEAL